MKPNPSIELDHEPTNESRYRFSPEYRLEVTKGDHTQLLFDPPPGFDRAEARVVAARRALESAAAARSTRPPRISRRNAIAFAAAHLENLQHEMTFTREQLLRWTDGAGHTCAKRGD